MCDYDPPGESNVSATKMCDFDPPIMNIYDPEFPLGSDDELDTPESSALGPFADSIQTNDLEEFHSDLVEIEPPNIAIEKPEPAAPVPVPKVYTDLFCVKTYTPKDLYPTEPDPACYPAWALSFYWPVYVANFRLNSLDEAERNTQISSYFAAKGLLSRMIYIREDEDEFFKIHQKKCYLLDMLVYFTSQEDAQRAIRCCHRTTYYGHRLNVFSGRVPEYFDPLRTARFQIPQEYSIEWTETPAELEFQRRGCENIETIAKHSDVELIVEFGDVYSMNHAVRKQNEWIPLRLTGPLRKQRYLEQDFKIELLWKILGDSSFISMVPPEDVLQHLLNGKIPPVQRGWENYTTPRDLPPAARTEIENIRLERKRELVENGQKRKAGQAAGKTPANGLGKKRKIDVNRKVHAFLEVVHSPNRWSRPERLKREFRSKSDEFLRTKSELLNQNRKKTLAVRNKLFYDLLKLEGQLLKIVEYLAALGTDVECEFLQNGLMAALKVANEANPFPKYPINVNSSDEEEPLDRLWPVYVGNFRVSDLNPKARDQQIVEFFAMKSFAIEMIYVGDNDPFYNSYLKHIKLLDMLIYFKSKEIADKFVTTYHSTMYRDSKLNVYSGREADYYFSCRTVFLELDPDPTVGEQSIERILLNVSPDVNVARIPNKAVLCFSNKTDQKAAIGTGMALTVLKPPIPKQRFLEADVKDDLRRRILYDAEFLAAQPNEDALRKLFVVDSMPLEPSGEVVWVGNYRKRKMMNVRIGVVLDEWLKLQ